MEPFGGSIEINPSGLKADLKSVKSLSLDPAYLHPGETINVNIKARVWSPGYYLFVIIPEVSPFRKSSCDCSDFKASVRSLRPPPEEPQPRR